MCAFHLPPRGRVPSTQSTIFSNLHWLVFVDKTKISKKEAGLAHLKRKKNKNLFSSSKVLFSESFYEATFSRVYLREDILCLDRCLEVIWIRALLPHKLCVATIELGAAWAFTNQGNVFLSPSTHRRWFPMTTWLLSWQFDVKQQSCPLLATFSSNSWSHCHCGSIGKADHHGSQMLSFFCHFGQMEIFSCKL